MEILLSEPVVDPIASGHLIQTSPKRRWKNGCALAVSAAASRCLNARMPARGGEPSLARGDLEMAAPTNGTIKRLVSEKGFGFVAASDGSEYFFHQSACNGCQFDSLREGQAVTFEKGQGPKGPRGENVRVA
jgi:CspA family cold shock protein